MTAERLQSLLKTDVVRDSCNVVMVNVFQPIVSVMVGAIAPTVRMKKYHIVDVSLDAVI